MPDYPSNISRAQFALIQPDLENFRKHTRPHRYDGSGANSLRDDHLTSY